MRQIDMSRASSTTTTVLQRLFVSVAEIPQAEQVKIVLAGLIGAVSVLFLVINIVLIICKIKRRDEEKERREREMEEQNQM